MQTEFSRVRLNKELIGNEPSPTQTGSRMHRIHVTLDILLCPFISEEGVITLFVYSVLYFVLTNFSILCMLVSTSGKNERVSV